MNLKPLRWSYITQTVRKRSSVVPGAALDTIVWLNPHRKPIVLGKPFFPNKEAKALG